MVNDTDGVKFDLDAQSWSAAFLNALELPWVIAPVRASVFTLVDTGIPGSLRGIFDLSSSYTMKMKVDAAEKLSHDSNSMRIQSLTIHQSAL